MSGDRRGYIGTKLPPLRDVLGEAYERRPSPFRADHASHLSPSTEHYRYGGTSDGPQRSFTLPAPVNDSSISRYRSSTISHDQPRFNDPALILPPLRLPAETALPPRRIATPAPVRSPAPPSAPKREPPKALPTLLLAPPGHQRQPLAKPYDLSSPPPMPGRSKSPKPSLMQHYRLNPPVTEGASDIFTYATAIGAPQPSTGPVNYTFTVMREQQGDLVDVRTPSSRAQGILRPTAIIDDEDQSHKRYKCDVPGCDKRYDRPSSLEVHRHSHSDNPAPFRCPHRGCSRTFSVKSNMLRHQRSHQPKERLLGSGSLNIPDPLDDETPRERFFTERTQLSSSPPLRNSPHKKT